MDIAAIARILFYAATVGLVIYSLTLPAKKGGATITKESIKKNIFKILTAALVLYSLYMNVLYFNVKKGHEKLHKKNLELMLELDRYKYK